MDQLTSRFLDAFNGVEDWLRHQMNAPEHAAFPDLLIEMAQASSDVRRHASSLKRLARLRNLIVHNYSREHPLAVPTTRSVEQIVTIRNQLVSPPLLVSVAASPVQTCRPTDPLGSSVTKMRNGVFSQLPIYDEQTFRGLLTAETIARWLAGTLEDGFALEAPVSDVVQHQEDPDNYTFFGRTATVADGLAAFDTFLRRGKRLEAVLVTHSGHKTESPLAIVTIHDVPKLRQAIQE